MAGPRDTENGTDERVLDNPVWYALVGAHRSLGQVTALAARYQSDVAPFGALAAGATPAHWVHLAELVGPGGAVSLTGYVPDPPESWMVSRSAAAVQLVLDGPLPRDGRPGTDRMPDAPGDVEVLGPDDVPAMLHLVELARPGPFRTRTVHLGGYVGFRRDGRLVAMAGERLHPPGYAEISAVATDPAYRNQGLATRLVRATAARILERGEIPFLHVASTNEDAIRLYRSLGFTVRREVVFVLATAPG